MEVYGEVPRGDCGILWFGGVGFVVIGGCGFVVGAEFFEEALGGADGLVGVEFGGWGEEAVRGVVGDFGDDVGFGIFGMTVVWI